MRTTNRNMLCVLALSFCTSASAADSGITATEIILGQSAPLSGPAAELGIQFNIGANAYFDFINEQGGVHGRKIRLLAEDDFNEASQAVVNTRKLINDMRVFALFGYVGSPSSVAALPLATDARVPFFAPSAGAHALREPNRYVFNVRASYRDELTTVIQHLITTGVANFAVFYENDAYGVSALADVEWVMRNAKVVSLRDASSEPNSTEVEGAVMSIVPTDPDTILMLCSYKSCAAFIKAARAAGYKGQFHHLSSVGTQALAEELGVDAKGLTVSQAVPSPWRGALGVVRDYQKVLEAKRISELNHSGLEGFIAARVLVEALRRVGRELTRERLLWSLESLGVLDLGGYTVSFSPGDHTGSRFAEMTLIGAGGQLVR